MVKLPHLRRIEADGALVLAVELHGDPVGLDLLDCGELPPVRNLHLLVWSGELDAISGGELTLDLPVDVHSRAAWSDRT